LTGLASTGLGLRLLEMWTARCGRRLVPSTHHKTLCLPSRHCSASVQARHHSRRLDCNHHQQDACSTRRNFSKYISVDHSRAYDQAMGSAHGMQIQLALEEGRGKDSSPYDPFSQFMDEIGTAEDMDDIQDEDMEEEDGEDEDEDEEGEYEEEADDYVDDADGEHLSPMYTTTGALYRPKSERLALQAGYPGGGEFAVINLAGFQHKVTKDDLLIVNKLKPVSEWSVGSTHTLKDDDILLMASQNKTLVGVPSVKGAEVDVMVEEITRDKTMVVFKKRRRKHSRRRNGFRREVTFLRVLDIRMPEAEQEDEINSDIGEMAA